MHTSKQEYAKSAGLNPDSPLADFGWKLHQAKTDAERVRLLPEIIWIPVSTDQEAVWLGRIREDLISLENSMKEAA